MSIWRRSRAAVAAFVAGWGFLAGACLRPTPEAGEELLVFAAASLRDVLTELGELYAARGVGRLVFNFAGSNVLARQLLARPRADLFISADETWTARLDERGLVAAGSRRALVSNRLVVVAHRRSPLRLDRVGDLATLDYRFLAVADPRAAPAGRYARRLLESVPAGRRSLWEAVADRIAPAADVRAALALVEAEPAAVGIVYATDARVSERVRVLLEVPEALTPEIRYSVVILKEAPQPQAAWQLLDFLRSPAAAAVFVRHGFRPLEGEG